MTDEPHQPTNAPEPLPGIRPEPWLCFENMVALLATIIWVVACVIVFWVADPLADGLQVPLVNVVLAVTTVLPPAMIWVVAFTVKNARISRRQSERLLRAVRSMREAHTSQTSRAMQDEAMNPAIQRRIGELAEGQERLEATLARMLDSGGMANPEDAEPPNVRRKGSGIAVSEQDESPPMTVAEIIQALNFPDSAEDEEGLAAYRRALKDSTMSGLIRASEDILTLFSRDAVYMDDLTAGRTRPDTWLKYSRGERGQEIAELGRVLDRECLEFVDDRINQDSVFRDAAEHFLRNFDKTFSGIADRLSNQEIAELADTRTARVFRLLGKVAGLFD